MIIKTLNVLITILFICFISACAAPVTTQLSNDTYVVFKEDYKGVFGSPSALKQEVLDEAARIATEHGGKVVKISDHFHPVGIAGDWASYRYEFRVVSPEDEMTIERASSLSTRCLASVAVEYDDGNSDVEQLADAIVNRCNQECILNRQKAHNLGTDSYRSVSNQCKSSAKDIIFRLRGIKRAGGETKTFGRFLYVKRSADMHYQYILSVFDVNDKFELSLHCQVGKESSDVNTHNFEINPLGSATWLTSGSDYDIEVLINSKPNMGFVIPSSQGISFPKLDVQKVATKLKYINFSIQGRSVKFPTNGIYEGLKKMKKECQI